MSTSCKETGYAFSNGTEGEAWVRLWCQRCTFDHATHRNDDYENGCELLARAYCHDFPEEWTEHSDEVGFTFPPPVVCSKFEPCGACGDFDGRNADAEATRVKLGGVR